MNVLAVGAHPDDVEWGCAGTLARHLHEGDNVDIVVMTSSTIMDAHSGAILRDATESAAEATNAAQVLGITPIIGPFQDTKVPFDGESVAFLERIIKEKKIDLIYTHWQGDAHQDHITTLNSVLAAGRLIPNIIGYEQIPVPRVSIITPKINYYVDITAHWDIKIEACKKHVSQTDKYKNKQGVDVIEQLEHQARYRGGQSGCKYAEGFHILKMVK